MTICGHDRRRTPLTVAIAAAAESTASHPSCEPSSPPSRTGPSNDQGNHAPIIVTTIAIDSSPGHVRTSAHHSCGERCHHRCSAGNDSSVTISSTATSSARDLVVWLHVALITLVG